MKHIVIIGAGFSGTLTALQLLKTSTDVLVTLVDKQERLNRGVAYSPPSETFRLNVPADGMGAWPEKPDDFYTWLQANDYKVGPKEFVPRLWFGNYLVSLVRETKASCPDRLTLVSAEVTDVTLQENGSFLLSLNNEQLLSADAVVLALGNVDRAKIDGVSVSQGLLPPYFAESYVGVKHCQDILILGSGLTAVDCILECESEGFTGKYTVLSRHGRLPLGFEPSIPACEPIERVTLGTTLRDVFSIIRKLSAEQKSSQPVIAAIRPYIQDIWAKLSATDKRRFLRHARSLWEIHRHRIPDSHLKKLNALGSQRLVQRKGNLAGLEKGVASIRDRYTKGITEQKFDKVMLCVGPESSLARAESPLIRSLLAKKLVEDEPLGLGSKIIAKEHLYLIGPLQKESKWEITAVRELRVEAKTLAERIVRELVH